MSDGANAIPASKWTETKMLGRKCLDDLKEMIEIEGVPKLARLIQKEVDVIHHMTTEQLKDLGSCNIHRYSALIRCMKQQSGLKAVLQTFNIRRNGQIKKSLSVDIVCRPKTLEEVWIKVISKSRRALTLDSLGDCSFGRANILDHAKYFVEASLQHIYNYKAPNIIFSFDSGVDAFVADSIMELGIEVRGNVECTLDDSDYENNYNATGGVSATAARIPKIPKTKSEGIKKLNLDVCSMIGYVSELANGGKGLVCDSQLLNLQALAEEHSPLVPILDELFEGKQLLCCNLALQAFEEIVGFLGGPKEKERSVALIKRLTIVSDTERPVTLKINKKITKRSAIVFMTGEDHQAVTVTANNTLANAAASQNQKFAVFIHEARSLSEMKGLSTNDVSK